MCKTGIIACSQIPMGSQMFTNVYSCICRHTCLNIYSITYIEKYKQTHICVVRSTQKYRKWITNVHIFPKKSFAAYFYLVILEDDIKNNVYKILLIWMLLHMRKYM